jgi:thymidine kinase
MITVILGNMFSGKTSELLRLLERYQIAKKRVILLRPKTDTRPFLSHSAKDTAWLEQQFVDLDQFDATDYDVVGLDEGQFHNGLKDFCVKWSLAGKTILVSALHASSESEMFEEIVRLIPHCDQIIKLNAICMECGNEANYTKYLAGNKTEQVAVGGSESYTALCARCYFAKME